MQGDLEAWLSDMADRPVSALEVMWESEFRFTSSDAYGHTMTVDAPRSEVRIGTSRASNQASYCWPAWLDAVEDAGGSA